MTTPNPGRRRSTPNPTHALLEPPRHDPDATNRRAPPSDLTQGRVVKSPSTNLAPPRSPLIGREYELAAVQQLLLQEQVGLLTLTGPGGIGKTRLALQVAAHLLDHFVDGVYFVALAPISDPDLVSAAIAQSLGVREAAGRSLQGSLHDYLRDKQLLLVLDNFEQVVAAAPLVGTLLTECRWLKALVTSRARLHLYGEHEFPVPPLALPTIKGLSSMEIDTVTSLAQYAAVTLFVQRARAVKPDFVLTFDNAPAVAQICIALDGLPLAIELAAARLKLFSPSALLARLNQRLTLLTGGPHDLPARQRTLRDEIAWGYDLLTASEQALFRRLAVFVGGFALEAAQAVGDADGDLGITVLDGVGALVDHNLLKRVEQSDGEPRFGMLETIRAYGLEQLEANGEGEAVRHDYVFFFLALAEATAPALEGAGQAAELARLALEHDNLRMALAWSQKENDGTEIALRLAGALGDFWLTGYWSEGRRWFEDALARTTTERTEVRARALAYAGVLAYMQADYSTARTQLEEGLTMARERDAKKLVAIALLGLSWLALEQHNYALALAQLEEGLAICRALGDKYMLGGMLLHLGSLMCEQQDYVRAQSLYEEGLALFQELGAEFDIADIYRSLGQAARLQGDYPRAWALFRESLARWRALGVSQWGWIAECLDGLATICAGHRQFVEAVRLSGAADALRTMIGMPTSSRSRNSFAGDLTTVRPQLDEAAFAAAWAEGRALSSEQAIEYALALPEIPASASPPVVHKPVVPIPSPYPAGLTPREVEVLRLLAHGLTYVQIADKLVVSRRTINAHVGSIYSKLTVNSRRSAIRFAVDHHLV
jgi:predicted ATPase/DNA-binding CsgD family transcriptional regulator